jgi:hypothetical protein
VIHGHQRLIGLISPHTIGVSTVRQYLSESQVPPNWITAGPGGDGFVEIADAVLQARNKS